ncbi:hypothetical protein GCM10009676_05950 [Prauserella halophila]|uniref:Polysaccharide pyruvyl transferase domain-containing protein n=1 Tax=Prauserella halophila TaxID=185641 RepID=A0ABP4GJ92_9PSEU|nr:polysaccharide pyruvyl transferase family protein [Prauserella halophila]MCP2237354.1 Polysaccharide pyruvyl transferase family protein WcaK [Prauserella halophila]
MSHVGAPASSRRIYLIGPAGLPNFGDELIAATWLRYLARTAPDAEVWLDCHTPGTAQVMLAGLHPGLRCTNTLWRLAVEAPAEEPWAVATWVRKAVHDPGLAPWCRPGIELLATADVIHLIGGGYVNALWPQHLGLLAGAVAAGNRSGARLAMTGQGLVPAAPDVAELLYSLAGRFDVVDVRDRDSADLLAVAVPAEFSCDDVFLDVPGTAVSDYTRPVMVCVQSDIGELGPPALAGRVKGILRSWEVDPADVTFVEAIPRVDRAVHDLLASDLPGTAFMPFSELWRDGVPAVDGQIWLSTRFHLHLTAAAAGARGVAMSVSPDYYGTKHRSLVELGSGWTMLDAAGTEVPGVPENGGYPADTVKELGIRKARVAERIYPEF